MLKGLVICPDSDLAEKLEEGLAEANRITTVRTLNRYPGEVEFMRLVRAHGLHVVFLSTEELSKAVEFVRMINREIPGLQVVAISRTCDSSLLLDVMRAGVREFLSLPLDPAALDETLSRADKQAQRSPAVFDSTGQLYAFLPSKQGVGTSTVALNAAMALSTYPDIGVLLLDMDLTAGIIAFMLKLNNANSAVAAAEASHRLDESIWSQLVSRSGRIDVLNSGPLNPEFRIESSQVRQILEFARRRYQAICVDLSGNLERYSLEIMREAKRIFLVVTPELPSLHLAKEKLRFLSDLDLADRVSVLLNRSHPQGLVSPAQIEDLVGAPVMMSFANDYQGVHKALQAGTRVNAATELGRQFAGLAASILDRAPRPAVTRSRWLEYLRAS